MTAAIVQIFARGPEDVPLTDSPKVSFFKSSYSRHTPFSKESVELHINGQVGWGQTPEIPLNKCGDLLGAIYLQYTIPGIRHKNNPIAFHGHQQPYQQHGYGGDYSSYGKYQRGGMHSHGCAEQSASVCKCCGSDRSVERSNPNMSMPQADWAYYSNAFAHVATEYAQISVGHQSLNSQMGEFLEIYDELSGKAGKATHELVGRYFKEAHLWNASKKEQIRYCRLRFWFCEHIGMALPILAIHHSAISLKVKIRPLRECFNTSDDSIPYLMNADRELNETDLKLKVFANVFYLSDEEREYINKNSHHFLITQNQFSSDLVNKCLSSSQARFPHRLPFTHPITELFFTLQKESHRKRKDWFNWCGENGEDPIAKVQITINNHPRFSEREGRWFRMIEPLEHHSSLPKRHIYSYSFSLYPEETDQPAGALNITRLENVSLHITPQSKLGCSVLNVHAVSYNIFRVVGGLCGVAWS